MKLLVLGGSVFLSRAVAQEAVARGHDVTCACRGTSGPLPEGVRHVAMDRSEPWPAELSGFDAVVDVAGLPSYVRRAVAALPDAHWIFVSTANVYADESTPGGRPATLPLRDPLHDDVDPRSSPEAYGAMKVACERLVSDGTVSSTIVRPGLIIGPEDPSGRFGYWVDRMARVPQVAEVLAPGDPRDTMQAIDVRDLAAWLVTLAEERRAGTYDGVGEPMPISAFLAEVARGCEVSPRWTWVPQQFLAEQGVVPWMGPRSLPLWLPRPEYDGLPAHDVSPSLAAGLALRPLADTARDTLAWLRTVAEPPLTGVTPAEEAEVLTAWHDGPGSSA